MSAYVAVTCSCGAGPRVVPAPLCGIRGCRNPCVPDGQLCARHDWRARSSLRRLGLDPDTLEVKE